MAPTLPDSKMVPVGKEEKSHLTTLIARDIPPELNNRHSLLDHFSQFGDVNRIICKPEFALVNFKDHSSALLAKNKAKKISPRFGPLSLQWCKSVERQNSTDKDPSSHPPTDPPSRPAPSLKPKSLFGKSVIRPSSTALPTVNFGVSTSNPNVSSTDSFSPPKHPVSPSFITPSTASVLGMVTKPNESVVVPSSFGKPAIFSSSVMSGSSGSGGLFGKSSADSGSTTVSLASAGLFGKAIAEATSAATTKPYGKSIATGSSGILPPPSYTPTPSYIPIAKSSGASDSAGFFGKFSTSDTAVAREGPFRTLASGIQLGTADPNAHAPGMFSKTSNMPSLPTSTAASNLFGKPRELSTSSSSSALVSAPSSENLFGKSLDIGSASKITPANPLFTANAFGKSLELGLATTTAGGLFGKTNLASGVPSVLPSSGTFAKSSESAVQFDNLFGKPSVPSANSAFKTPATLFGKPLPPQSTPGGTPAVRPSPAPPVFPSQPPPPYQFPRTELIQSSQSTAASLFTNTSSTDTSSKQTGSFITPGAFKWNAGSGLQKPTIQPTVRPAFLGAGGPVGPIRFPDGGKAKGNMVWTKEPSNIPKIHLPSRMDLPQRLERAAETVTPATNPRLGVVTRSEIKRSASPRLNELFNHSANTVGDRHKLLDLRDKLLREDMSSVKTGPTRGTCPDMCPEKERYHRCDRNLVSSFETIPGADGVMDPTKMVKEYQRSSADQELPLPHELRPPQVLEMTMNYLISNIINNQPTENVGDWFNFVWNRTRAIRKDITQQNIEADTTSALIVERCTRFHIHCAHSLCEEDVASFDSKLNDENMTKSLQTLKYAYHDLNIQGVRCPNEAEFTAYDILLNLKEGATSRSIHVLRQELRTHPLVGLAIAALHALNEGNYVRFFKVARRSPYLISCILHRYFTEVRVHALMMLAKASNKTGDLLARSLVNVLFFNNVEECESFLHTAGVDFDTESGVVNIRGMISLEGKFELLKSNEIDWKRGSSLASVVYGGDEVPEVEYRPHDSFTADGILRGTRANAPNQDYSLHGDLSSEPEISTTQFAPSIPKFTAPAYETPKPPAPPRVPTDAEMGPAADCLIEDAVNREVGFMVRAASIVQSVSQQTMSETLESVAKNELRLLAEKVYNEELFDLIVDEVCKVTVVKNAALILRQVCSEEINKIGAEVIDVLTESNCAKMMALSVATFVRDIAQELHDHAVDEYKENLAENFRERQLSKRTVTKWRKFVWLQKEIRSFPAAPRFGREVNYGLRRISPTKVRESQHKWDLMRFQSMFTHLADEQPLKVKRVFGRKYRLLTIVDGLPSVAQKVRLLLREDPTGVLSEQVPKKMQGFNAVLVINSGSSTALSDVVRETESFTPRPSIGVLWCDQPAFVNIGVEEEMVEKGMPLCVSLYSLLKKIARKLPEESVLRKTNLREFVNGGLEHCFAELAGSCGHLRTVVQVYNDVVRHLAAVAASQSLPHVNSLDVEAGWNSSEVLSELYDLIICLQLPIPETENRLDFIRSVEKDKNMGLMCTTVNMENFKNALDLVRDVFSRLSFTLSVVKPVHFLPDDLHSYRPPRIWYSRSSCSTQSPPRTSSPAVSVESIVQIDDSDDEDELIQDSVKKGKMSSSEWEKKKEEYELLLRRIRISRLKMNKQDREVRKLLSRPYDNTTPVRPEPPTRKSSEHENTNEESWSRVSKKQKISMAVDDIRRKVDRLKDRKRVDKMVADTLEGLEVKKFGNLSSYST